MRILRLQAENVKKLKCVDITPDADTVILTGRNEQGKTSALDAIEYVLAGGKALKYTPEPIRRGEKKAVAHVYLGEPQYDDYGKEVKCEPNLKVTRTWTANDKSYLKVENPDGSVRKAGQSVLDSIIGNLTFDPLAFSLLKEREQLDTLLSLVDIPLDLDQWAADRKAVYDERTAVNRKWTELDGQIKGIIVPDDTPDEEISAASVLNEQRAAQSNVDANNKVRRELLLVWEELERQRKNRASLEAKIAELKKELEATCTQIEQQEGLIRSLETQASTLVDPDMSVFAQRITEVEEVNRRVRAKWQRTELEAKQEEARLTAETLTLNLAQRDKEREIALAAAQMPIEHLAFDDNGVTYKGIPFRQCSSEERLRVSVAMGMALNPKLRVMFVRDASLLDDANREVMRQMARDNQYQIWMEVVGGRDSNGIVFEEGEVVANNKSQG